MIIKKGVSITLCTYNGKALLKQTLEHIVYQILDIPCELILIDNASTDGTKDFADQWWLKHGVAAINYRSYTQPIAGKSYAQDMAYDKAKYEYLLVCDDDNWLASNYVQHAYNIMENNLQIGALGGCSSAAFKQNAPSWFYTYAHYYAVGKQAQQAGDITRSVGHLYGAGMVIRKSHWLELKALGFEHLLSCRKGESLSSGGDTEYCYAIRLLGYQIWYDESLTLIHFMVQGRLNFSYLSSLRKSMVYSNFVIYTYKCVLYDILPSRAKEFSKKLTYQFLKKCYKLILGAYSEKEAAKTYFRELQLLLFSYDERRAHYEFIKSWVANKK